MDAQARADTVALAPSLAPVPPRSRGAAPPTSVAASPLARAVCIGATVLFLSLFLLVPLVAVFVEAFRKGQRFTWPPSASRLPWQQSG